MRLRLPFYLRLILMGVALLLLEAVGCCDETVSIVDSTGSVAGGLPVLQRGDVKMIPLRTLSLAAGWDNVETDSGCTVSGSGDTVVFRAANPFAIVGRQTVQLHLPPELWDGSFWVPLPNVERLFTGKVTLMAGDTTLLIVPPASSSESSLNRTADPATSSPVAYSWALKTIIIDAGHGGKDPGAPGPRGWKEKAITLDIAMRLASLVEKRGLTATLTRDRDEFVSLQRRTHIANEAHGDLFLSIHCNSNRDKRAHGVEAYFLKPARTERAVEVALRENSVVKYEGAKTQYRDLTQDNYILLSMATSQNLKDSEGWAAKITQRAAARARIASRGVDQAGFYVLMGAIMPAVLVECGYLSNAKDARLLLSEQGRQELAEALLNSVLDMKTKLETAASK